MKRKDIVLFMTLGFLLSEEYACTEVCTASQSTDEIGLRRLPSLATHSCRHVEEIDSQSPQQPPNNSVARQQNRIVEAPTFK